MKHDVNGGSAVAEPPRSENTSFQKRSDRNRDAAPPDKSEIQQKVEAAGTPGAGHEALDAFVGEWKADVKCWMEPGSPPQESRGMARVAWILNRHFLREEFEGEMMGKPFKGLWLLGYDNTKQAFNSMWVDDTNTSMFTAEGKGDAGYTTITLEGKVSCPVTGRKDVPMKVVLSVISRDQHLFEMFDASKGHDVKSMEITYTRR